VRVARTDSELGWWEIASGLAPAHLRPYAREITGYRFDTQPLRTREVPTGSLWLIVSLGDSLDVLPGARLVSFAVGLQDRAAVTEHGGRQHGVQVQLTPLGAARCCASRRRSWRTGPSRSRSCWARRPSA
jgi:hypothetical protein